MNLLSLLNPYVLGGIGVALIISHGWAFNQGRHMERWMQVASIEASNKKVRAANKTETERHAAEEEKRTEAAIAAVPVLATQKCAATKDVAAALSRIK